ncbi:MAG TPA: EamA family transporter [Myxococcota bacterium]|nr:EamA family transporter [Myxococcota bacterium]HRY95509.1 EamA family transporter [Myxococcota bacterium]HSA22724.1 EamA family transporter [Myxococcota bacterium]
MIAPGTRGLLAGGLAIAFWSASVAVSRELAEALGVLTAPSLTYLAAGLLGTAWLALRGRLRPALRLGRPYLLGCGALFVVYLVSYCLAIGLCRSGQEVVEVGLVNYLWPALTLLLSVPLLGHRAGPWLLPGMSLALAGVFLAGMGGAPLSLDTLGGAFAAFAAHLRANPAPYALSLVNAVAWSVYSNLARRLVGERQGGAVPLFLLASGLALVLARAFFPETARWSPAIGLELAAMILLPGLLAYVLWEVAMRSPHMVLVTALSYLIPLFSTLITTWAQALPMGPGLWLGCALLVAGAVVCKLSVRPAPAQK